MASRRRSPGRGVEALSVGKPLRDEAQGQDGLAAPRWPQDRRGVARRNPTSHQLVERRDSGGDAPATAGASPLRDRFESGKHLTPVRGDAEGVPARQVIPPRIFNTRSQRRSTGS